MLSDDLRRMKCASKTVNYVRTSQQLYWKVSALSSLRDGLSNREGTTMSSLWLSQKPQPWSYCSFELACRRKTENKSFELSTSSTIQNVVGAHVRNVRRLQLLTPAS